MVTTSSGVLPVSLQYARTNSTVLRILADFIGSSGFSYYLARTTFLNHGREMLNAL